MAIAGFHPADAVIGHHEANQMAITKAGDKGGAVAIAIIATDITGGRKTLLLQAIGKGPQAQHQIFNDGSIVLGKTGKHRRPSGGRERS